MKQQRCSQCDDLTGRCEDDTLWVYEGEPLCEECYEGYPECDKCGYRFDADDLRGYEIEDDDWIRLCEHCRP